MDCKTASQQHLSNYIWWHVGIQGKPISFAAEKVAELIERFDNKILPYRPIPWYNNEIIELINKGLIFLVDGIGIIHDNTPSAIIIYKSKVIGEILSSDHKHFSHLKH